MGVLITRLLPWMLLNNLAIIGLLVYVLIDPALWSRFLQLVKKPLFWTAVGPFLIFMLGLSYSHNLTAGWKAIETRAPLVVFPVVMGLTTISKRSLHQILLVFVAGVIGAAGVGFLLQALEYFSSNPDAGLFYNDNLVSAFHKQAVYYAFYVNVSLMFVYVLYLNKANKTGIGKHILWAILPLVIIQYLLASRMSMVTTLILLFIFFAYMAYNRLSRMQSVLLLLGSLSLLVALLSFFPKVLNRFESITHVEYRYDNPNPINHFNGEIKKENWNGLNTRLALWSCATEEIKKSPFWGFGIGDVHEVLMQHYASKNFVLALSSGYNSHNQFLDVLLTNGIVGLMVFMLFLLYPFYIGINDKNWLLVGFLLVFLLSCLTENMLSRTQGVVVIALFFSMLLFQPTKAQIKE